MTSAKPRCFVISPIGDKGSIERRHADMVLHSVLEQALPDYEVKRADAFGAAEMISDKIIEAITTHDLAVADLTFSNPNVFYELGLRHMAEKPVIHIAGDGTKLPFDNSGVSTIFFDVTDIHSHKQARDEIAKAAAVVMTKGYKVSNPVTQARGSISLSVIRKILLNAWSVLDLLLLPMPTLSSMKPPKLPVPYRRDRVARTCRSLLRAVAG